QEAYNLDTLQGLVRITIRIVRGALALEAAGALLYSIQFIREFGFPRGVWYSIFHSVSAFCNAGLDLIGSDSLISYRGNVLVNVVTMLLIILGGIGFPVWWNILDNVRELRRRRRRNKPGRFQLSPHARIALTATAVLTLSGAALTFAMEYGNPETLGGLPFGEKLLASLFQSVTLRTAGFQTIPQQSFRDGTCMVFLLLMIIGGSPSGTAGGVKTVTAALVLASVTATVRGEETGLLKRKFSDRLIKKAVAVSGVSIAALFVLTTLLMAVQDSDFLDTLYEMTSAMATVGLSRNFTGSLTGAGRLIVILGMYLGRIGPITMALAINVKHSGRKLSHPEGRALVG
ncbi:MAG: potassium transporter KtrB, partial [Lachnospiraceae bacterium]|nr:potassium transporter KtrB [Lachnospiraceae bacterium]